METCQPLDTEMETTEKHYQKDWENFCDHGDIGDDWCGEDVVQAILTWIKSNIECDQPVISLGCGNAALLFQLCHLGYTSLTGIDKSPTAIKLATEISHQECPNKVELKVCDVLESIPSGKADSPLNRQYRLVIDKGMFDFVAATSKNLEEFRNRYLKNIHRLLQPSGILLMATCNQTEEELKQQISPGFLVREVLPTPVFEFQGKKGHNVTVIAFEKKN